MSTNHKDFNSLKELEEIWKQEEDDRNQGAFINDTSAALDAAFKQLYSGMIKDLYSTDTPLLKMIPKDSGKKVNKYHK